MYTKIASATAVVILLLAVSSSGAQGKYELPTASQVSQGIIFFTGVAINHPVFELPANGELNQTKGNIILKAAVKGHSLHGDWKTYYNENQLMDMGTLVKGVPDGLWQTWYSNGQLKSVRNYSSDLLTRVQQDVTLNHPRISKFAITRRYKKEGGDVLYVLRSSYSYNKGHFEWPEQPFELVVHNALNPSNYSPPFKYALHHGLFLNYFENGVVKDSGYYKEGMRDGLWIHRTEATAGTWKGLYQNGVRQKEWKYYSHAGKLLLIVFFNHKGEEAWRKTM